jgi:ribonuclease HI
MYFDGSLKLQGAGAGILFIALGGEQLKYALQLLFSVSNNAAEYEALIHGQNIAISGRQETDGIWRFTGDHKSDKQIMGLLE